MAEDDVAVGRDGTWCDSGGIGAEIRDVREREVRKSCIQDEVEHAEDLIPTADRSTTPLVEVPCDDWHVARVGDGENADVSIAIGEVECHELPLGLDEVLGAERNLDVVVS